MHPYASAAKSHNKLCLGKMVDGGKRKNVDWKAAKQKLTWWPEDVECGAPSKVMDVAGKEKVIRAYSAYVGTEERVCM